jgi:hypothetical protein
MPTPTSGQISMLDMRAEITRGTGAISMSEVRTRYGGSGQINFSDLYKSEGFIATCGTYSDKFSSEDGVDVVAFNFGSFNPNEANGRVQFAANSYLGRFTSTPSGIGDAAALTVYSNANSAFGGGVTVGFTGDSITRIVTANVARGLNAATENTREFTYDFPSSGTVHCLVKF